MRPIYLAVSEFLTFLHRKYFKLSLYSKNFYLKVILTNVWRDHLRNV